MMKLIKEFRDLDLEIIKEEVEGKKSYFIEGIFLQSNKQNRNGRVYPVQVLDTEVARYNEEMIKTGRAIGELGHPDTPSLNLERISHIIKSLKREGDDFIGKAKLMDTPYGQIAKNLIDEGVKLGVSSRGMGSLKPLGQNIQEVQSDYYLSTVDIVADPSAPDAFVEGILENREWVWENGIIKEKVVQEIKTSIIKAPKKKLAETKLKAFEKFLKGL